MRVAIFHHSLDNIGGAEKVTLLMGRLLKGDVFTTNIDRGKIVQMGFADLVDRIYSLGTIPKIPPFKQESALRFFSRLNLKQSYDLYIISGDWAIGLAQNYHPNIWYAHSGLNEIWDLQEEIEKNILAFWQIVPYRIWIKSLRPRVRKYVALVDKVIANSSNTKNRIRKYYGREAEVIYPPVDTSSFFFKKHKNYWLSVNRLVTHKRVEIQLETFRLLPQEKLIIVGSYEKGVPHMERYKNYLLSIKPQNVEIRHWVSQEELKELYAYAKGLIATSLNEDFGLNAVEAMASGKPVIAPKSGGYGESVIDGKTGILIEKLNPYSLKEAIVKVNENIARHPFYYFRNCVLQAENFSIQNFITHFKSRIDEVVENKVNF